ncbi:MAG: VOC family protein [Pseudomonadota bacterium]
MKLNPYLLLDGTSEEALTFYADIFGVTKIDIMKYGNMPDDMPVPDEAKDLVANGNIKIGDNNIHMSDRVQAWHGDHKPIAGVTIQIETEDTAEAQRIFDALAEAGAVTMAPSKTFWSPLFGTLTDKFGVDWMINCVEP